MQIVFIRVVLQLDALARLQLICTFAHDRHHVALVLKGEEEDRLEKDVVDSQAGISGRVVEELEEL